MVREVAGRLKITEQTVRNWIDDGKLSAVRVGRRVRVLGSDFEKLVSASYHPGSGAEPVKRSDDAQGFWDGTWVPEAKA